jgi:hypothetical protein
MLSVIYKPFCAECCYAECRYAECHNAECRYAECCSAMVIKHNPSQSKYAHHNDTIDNDAQYSNFQNKNDNLHYAIL